jgi:site-specific DNA recombinase
VRELVAGGGAHAVAALYRDRFARGIYTQLLAAELAEHGTRLIALNIQGDDSPDGELADGIMDVISGWIAPSGFRVLSALSLHAT